MSIEDAARFAKLAVELDGSGNKHDAVINYHYAANILECVVCSMSPSKVSSMKDKIVQYRTRAAQLGMESQDTEERELRRCYFLFDQALDADTDGQMDEAVEFYTKAVELGLTVKCQDPEKKAKLNTILNKALERAEFVKGLPPLEARSTSQDDESEDVVASMKNIALDPSVKPTTSPTVSVRATPKPSLHRGNSAHLKVPSGQALYTEEEKLVLMTTSQINNNVYVPFMSIDLSENFKYTINFTDKDGKLSLSDKQKKTFKTWARPEEISADPKMIIGPNLDCFSIKQTVISDCSFVASLAVSSLYEKKFNKRLITSIIYPKKRNGDPVINPFGKYMVKLHLNGVPRKIIIDDYLPVDKYNQLLCSYSNNKNEFWVSLMEKAYMKVMGGYDFPGSNSSIDLHALTGWIPERSAIRKKESDFNATALFETIQKNLDLGNMLATVATGELTPLDETRTGLVTTHAYAVLDAKIVDGVKLLQLKNPWSHLRWRGNYSELDTVHWTPSLKSKLNYDPVAAAMYDNGVFWIDYESILHFFDVFYFNWNPELFQFTYCLHQLWNADAGPVRDGYSIGDNPQFMLEVQGKGDIWILLTRHITDIEDFKENKEYITVLVYKNEGRRVYYPHDPSPYIDGVRINSPHYLCKMNIGPNSSTRYTLVISQYEKMRTIYYTLRAYGTCPFKLRKLSPFPIHKKIVGEWKGSTAGGCANNRTHGQNPQYLISLSDCVGAKHLVLELRGPKEYQVGMDVKVQSLDDPNITAPFVTKSSGPYRSGFVVLELPDLPSGKYRVIVSTFYPGQEGAFIISIKSTADVKVSLLS